MSKIIDYKNLEERYLLWLYKTTKEAIDRIDRKFTQLEIDKYSFKQIKKYLTNMPDSQKKPLEKGLSELADYIANKEKDASAGNPNYQFLRLKLLSIEAAIKKFLGVNKLRKIRYLYHQEMTKRILEERIHK